MYTYLHSRLFTHFLKFSSDENNPNYDYPDSSEEEAAGTPHHTIDAILLSSIASHHCISLSSSLFFSLVLFPFHFLLRAKDEGLSSDDNDDEDNEGYSAYSRGGFSQYTRHPFDPLHEGSSDEEYDMDDDDDFVTTTATAANSSGLDLEAIKADLEFFRNWRATRK